MQDIDDRSNMRDWEKERPQLSTSRTRKHRLSGGRTHRRGWALWSRACQFRVTFSDPSEGEFLPLREEGKTVRSFGELADGGRKILEAQGEVGVTKKARDCSDANYHNYSPDGVR